MSYSDDDREDDINLDDIDLMSIRGQIEILQVETLMDGGTIIFHCHFKDKHFRIASTQYTLLSEGQRRAFLHLNKKPIRVNSEDEKVLLKLLKESINAADKLRILPKFFKKHIWSKRKHAYWIEIFKNEVLNFIHSKEYADISDA